MINSNTNPTITNSIIWGNNPNQIQGFGTPTITYSDIQGGWNGVGNIDSDPLFSNPDSSDFTLTENSPCKDAGNSSNHSTIMDATALLNEDLTVPSSFFLHQNYLNPFNPITRINYNMSNDGNVLI